MKLDPTNSGHSKRTTVQGVRNAIAELALPLAVVFGAGNSFAQTQGGAPAIPSEHAAHMAHDMDMLTTATLTSMPGNSVFQVTVPLTDQEGNAFHLGDRKGQPMLISMFYNGCKFVCPMLIDTMQLTERTLTSQERAGLNMTLVSFDPKHDEQKALKAIVTNRQLETPRWVLARAKDSDVRKIAAALGIQYRQLPDGEFNHTTIILLLDGEGRIIGRTKKMGGVDPQFLAQIKQSLVPPK